MVQLMNACCYNASRDLKFHGIISLKEHFESKAEITHNELYWPLALYASRVSSFSSVSSVALFWQPFLVVAKG